MKIKPLFYTIFKSLNPYSYKELSGRKFPDAMRYFCFLMLFSLVVMFILFIPALISFPSFWQKTTSNFDKLDFNVDLKLKQQFSLVEGPFLIKFTDNKNATIGEENFLVKEDSVSYRRFLFFGRQESIPIDKNIDMKSDSRIRMLFGMELLFIWPALFFWFFVVFGIYFWIVILLSYVVMAILTWVLRFNISLAKLFKTAVYSSTVLIVLQLVLMPFFRMFWIPLIAYWALFLMIVMFMKEELSDRREGGRHGSNDFFSHHDSGLAGARRVEKRESYDADEHGNARLDSVRRRKRSFEKENEGYVELK